MKGLEHFERWADLARMEQAPQPDVASAVLRRLRKIAVVPESPTAGMWVFTTASACAAAVCAILGYDTWLMLLGDWYGWIQDFTLWGPI